MKIQNLNAMVGRQATQSNANAVSILQRTKQPNGEYIITLPINTSDEVLVNIQTGETLTDRLIQINNYTMGIIEDLSSVILKISAVLNDDLQLNYMYRDSFKTDEKLLITSGDFVSGSLSGNTIEYELQKAIISSRKPVMISIKDIKSKDVESDEVQVLLTVNADDDEPYWIDCTEQYLNNQAITVPNIIDKDNKKPWSINVKFIFNCIESISISDLIISHI